MYLITLQTNISDNPKTNAALLTMEIETMTEMALETYVMITDFMDKYWNKHVEGKEKLDEEDKTQLIRLYRSLASIIFLTWCNSGRHE